MTCWFIFEFPRLVGIADHKILPELVAFHFDLTAHILRTEVFGLTSNASEKRRSFIELGFYAIVYWLGDIGLLSVNILGVETIDTSVMALYCC